MSCWEGGGAFSTSSRFLMKQRKDFIGSGPEEALAEEAERPHYTIWELALQELESQGQLHYPPDLPWFPKLTSGHVIPILKTFLWFLLLFRWRSNTFALVSMHSEMTTWPISINQITVTHSYNTCFSPKALSSFVIILWSFSINILS